MIQIVGYAKKAGSFTPQNSKDEVEYNNIILYVISDVVPDVNGFMSFEIKIKAANFMKITNNVKVEDILNHVVEMNYVSTGKASILCSIKVVDDEKTA